MQEKAAVLVKDAFNTGFSGLAFPVNLGPAAAVLRTPRGCRRGGTVPTPPSSTHEFICNSTMVPSLPLPQPALACSSLVSLESLKGTWVELGSALALMHMPRVVSDRLMLLASVARSPGGQQAEECKSMLVQQAGDACFVLTPGFEYHVAFLAGKCCRGLWRPQANRTPMLFSTQANRHPTGTTQGLLRSNSHLPSHQHCCIFLQHRPCCTPPPSLPSPSLPALLPRCACPVPTPALCPRLRPRLPTCALAFLQPLAASQVHHEQLADLDALYLRVPAAAHDLALHYRQHHHRVAAAGVRVQRCERCGPAEKARTLELRQGEHCKEAGDTRRGQLPDA